MDSHSIFALLTLALGLGLVHALDADHVMAISNLIGNQSSVKTSLKFCARWAIGHGAALLAVGFVVFILGKAIPIDLSSVAEAGVGVVLILLGAWVLWGLYRKKAHLHFHQHDGLPEHAHWHSHGDTHDNKSHGNRMHEKISHDNNSKEKHKLDNHAHNHSAVMIGILHGTAGSAPLLALIPLSKMASPWLGLAYLSLFAVGVLLSMLFFGGILTSLIRWLQLLGNKVINGFRIVVALSSVVFGIYLLAGNTP